MTERSAEQAPVQTRPDTPDLRPDTAADTARIPLAERLQRLQAFRRPRIRRRFVEGDERGVAAEIVPHAGSFMYCRITLEKSFGPLPSIECFW